MTEDIKKQKSLRPFTRGLTDEDRRLAQQLRTDMAIALMLQHGLGADAISHYLSNSRFVLLLSPDDVAHRIQEKGGLDAFIAQANPKDLPDEQRLNVSAYIKFGDEFLRGRKISSKKEGEIRNETHAATERKPILTQESETYDVKLKKRFNSFTEAILSRGKITAPALIRMDYYVHNGKNAIRIVVSMPRASDVSAASGRERSRLQELGKMQKDLVEMLRTELQNASQDSGALAALFQGENPMEEILVYIDEPRRQSRGLTLVAQYPVQKV